LAFSTSTRGAEPAKTTVQEPKSKSATQTPVDKIAEAKKAAESPAAKPGVAAITDGPPDPINSPGISPRGNFDVNLEPTGGRMPAIELMSQKGIKTFKSAPRTVEPRPLQPDGEAIPVPANAPKSTRRVPDSTDANSTPKSGKIVLKPFVPGEAPAETESDADSDSAISPEIRQRIKDVLAHYYTRKLNTRDHNHWEIMHQIVAFGVKTEILKNGPHGEAVNAISYECWNQPCRGETMLYRMGNLPAARQGPRVQGHEGQFLKMLAMAGVSKDYPMQVDNKLFKISDLIEQEKLGCRSGMELTFKLIALAYYLDDLDETWTARDRGTWNVERLIKEELAQPILRNAACGGTHRLMGFSMAIRQRERSGKPLTGEFERAERYIDDYIKYTLGLQNPEGNFSTEWFRGRANAPSLDRRLQTTGHILEWLVFTLPDDKLSDPRIVKAVDYLSTIMADGRDRQWEIGPMGHALHALAIYDKRLANMESPATPDEPAKPTREIPSVKANKKPDDEAAEAPAPEPTPRTATNPKRIVRPADPKKVEAQPVEPKPVFEDELDVTPAKPKAKPVEPTEEPTPVDEEKPAKKKPVAEKEGEKKSDEEKKDDAEKKPADAKKSDEEKKSDDEPADEEKPAEGKKPVKEKSKEEEPAGEEKPAEAKEKPADAKKDDDKPADEKKDGEEKESDKKDEEKPAKEPKSEGEPTPAEPKEGEPTPAEPKSEEPKDEKPKDKPADKEPAPKEGEGSGPSFPGAAKKKPSSPGVIDLWYALEPGAGRLPPVRRVEASAKSNKPTTPIRK